MSELNREQIIKALECCIKTQCENCCNLGDWHEQWNCMTNLMSKALTLIKELTEENERWRADTVRKMQERLKADAVTIQDHTGKLGVVVGVGNIDDVAREMLEGDNEN